MCLSDELRDESFSKLPFTREIFTEFLSTVTKHVTPCFSNPSGPLFKIWYLCVIPPLFHYATTFSLCHHRFIMPPLLHYATTFSLCHHFFTKYRCKIWFIFPEIFSPQNYKLVPLLKFFHIQHTSFKPLLI